MAFEPQIYYVRWRTWKESEVKTPWDFWYLKQGNDLRLRKGATSTLKPSQELIQAAFESHNHSVLSELDTNFVADTWLTAFVFGVDEDSAKQVVRSLFEDAEFDRVQMVNRETMTSIISLYNQTQSGNS